jgi:hypothetical protein
MTNIPFTLSRATGVAASIGGGPLTALALSFVGAAQTQINPRLAMACAVRCPRRWRPAPTKPLLTSAR